ncbi:PIN-like domain-containing protein [Desulfobacterota bacterium AH_259_B03_O07]|nr:PIN-like domain-containing protein [Desulfobacterota bacterium AH_259_B03_O07]
MNQIEEFSAFRDLTEEDLKKITQESIIVLDSSFLLTIYRLPVEIRNELISTLKTLKDRLFVPHFVVIEFNRNRRNVINEQKKKFNEIIELFDNYIDNFNKDLDKLQIEKRHSLIDPSKFKKKIEELIDSFKQEIKKIEEKEKEQLEITGQDKILEQLEDIIRNNIGEAPKNQEDINAIYAEAKDRYDKKIPPGFKDFIKEEKEDNYFLFGGIKYNRSYGDYLIWQQIIHHSKNSSIDSLIFLTDDEKEDWWNSISGQKIGPRIELRDEIKRKAQIEVFNIYTTPNFLTVAREHFNLRISPKSINVARKIISLNKPGDARFNISDSEYDAIYSALDNITSDIILNNEEFAANTADSYTINWDLCKTTLNFAYKPGPQSISFEAIIYISGDENPEKPYPIDTIKVLLRGSLVFGKNYEKKTSEWRIQDYRVNQILVEPLD